MKKTIKIEDVDYSYYFSPAQSDNCPILFIFHGVGYSERPAKFDDPEINVVCVMDDKGMGGQGSWYIGEKGKFTWGNVISVLLAHIKDIAKSNTVYFWGSSMGGYAALLHGYLNDVDYVYANVPQTYLLGSTFIKHGRVTDDITMQASVDYIFQDANEDFLKLNNLRNIFISKKDTVFFLTFCQLEGLCFFTEQGLPFIEKLHSIKQRMYLEVIPRKAHAVNYTISETIELFNRIANKID